MPQLGLLIPIVLGVVVLAFIVRAYIPKKPVQKQNDS